MSDRKALRAELKRLTKSLARVASLPRECWGPIYEAQYARAEEILMELEAEG